MDVNWRFLAAAMWLILAVGISARMLFEEQIASPEERTTTDARKQDRLLGELEYRKDRRARNFELFGFAPADATKAAKEAQDIEDAHGARIRRMLENAEDADALADVFCGERIDLPSRYRALPYLVDVDAERRQTIRLGRVSTLEEHDWAATSGIAEVYRELELGNERQPDATIMGVAAILVEREEDVFDHNAPWGQSFGAQWSWRDVKREHRGVEELVTTYLATLHVINEIAREDGGLCQD